MPGEEHDHAPDTQDCQIEYMGVYAQTAENSVTLRHDVECAGVDAVALLVAHPALSGNTCLATGERQTTVPSLQPLQKQCEKPCRYGLPCANHMVEVSRTSGDGTLIAWNARGAGSELGRQNFRRFGRTTPLRRRPASPLPMMNCATTCVSGGI